MKKSCILVVDDTAISRAVVHMILKGEYAVEEAVDGLDAVKHIETDPDRYACVLLDMMMPNMDGYKTIEYLSSKNLLGKFPVIACTGITDSAGKIRCYESGAIDIIEKPFDKTMLKFKIKYNINRFRYGQQIPVRQTAGAKLDRLRDYVRSTYGLTDDQDVEKLVSDFMTAFKECADAVSDVQTANDFAKMKDIARKIRDFAPNVGAADLDRIARMTEVLAENGRNGEIMQTAAKAVSDLYLEYAGS